MTPSDEHACAISSQPRRAEINSCSCFFDASSYKVTLLAFLPLASLHHKNKEHKYLEDSDNQYGLHKYHI